MKTVDESTAANDRYWELDQLGNWQKIYNGTTSSSTELDTRTHNTANELTASTANADPAHDAAGNMTMLPKPTAMGSSYTATYDAWNRLVSLKAGSDDVQLNLYDGLHRRTMRITDTDDDGVLDDVKRFYYNEQWQCLEEQDYAGNLQRQYVWRPYYIDALAVTYDGSGNKVYLLHDANFNVTAAILFNGALLERYHYSPYGEVTVLDADFSLDTDGASDIGNEHLYTGRRTDPVTGLQLNRRRFYHAALGRFINRDPATRLSRLKTKMMFAQTSIGFQNHSQMDMMDLSPDGYNLYQYCESQPLIYVDPTGEVTLIGGCAIGASWSGGTSFVVNWWKGCSLKQSSCYAACAAANGCIQGGALAALPSWQAGCIAGAIGGAVENVCVAGCDGRAPNQCDVYNTMISAILGCIGGGAAGADDPSLDAILIALGINVGAWNACP